MAKVHSWVPANFAYFQEIKCKQNHPRFSKASCAFHPIYPFPILGVSRISLQLEPTELKLSETSTLFFGAEVTR